MNKLVLLQTRFVLVLACASLAWHCAHGTTVTAPSFQELVQSADLIFTGQVTRQRCEWRTVDGQRSIVTLVTFDVTTVHKGDAGGSIDLQFLGGKIGDVTMEVDSMPQFRRSERVVLFVEKNGVNASALVAFHHGKFSLRKGPADDIVLDHSGTEVVEVSAIGRTKTDEKPEGRRVPMTHREFTAKIAQALPRPAP